MGDEQSCSTKIVGEYLTGSNGRAHHKAMPGILRLRVSCDYQHSSQLELFNYSTKSMNCFPSMGGRLSSLRKTSKSSRNPPSLYVALGIRRSWSGNYSSKRNSRLAQFKLTKSRRALAGA